MNMNNNSKKNNKVDVNISINPNLLLLLFIVAIAVIAFLIGVQSAGGNRSKEDYEEAHSKIDSQNTSLEEPIETIEESDDGTSTTRIESQGRKTYTFRNEYGNNDKEIKIEADYIERLSGFSGATNNVYYVKDNTLYYLELKDLNNVILATGVIGITKSDTSGIYAFCNKQFDRKADNEYVTYLAAN